MTELKTLKDLIISREYLKPENYALIDAKVLKAEAVKWIKEIQDEIKRLEERANKGLPIEKLKIWENIGKSNVLMDFFNLTEDDLK